jgi:4-hydroxy-4-methyl-2-oxoglutarate aldolase
MQSHAELFGVIQTRLSSAVIGDVLDAAGFRHQFLPPEIRPLDPGTVLVGFAMPVLETDFSADEHPDGAEPFGLMFRALDSLKPGDVYLATGASPTYALWGELMSTRAQRLGAAGAVLHGFHRDTRAIRRLGLPVFSHGAYAQDQRLRGRVTDFACPVLFPNEVRVAPGDLVFGDVDGVVIVPKQNLGDVVASAVAKAEGEDRVRAMIEQGDSAEAAFARTGIM